MGNYTWLSKPGGWRGPLLKRDIEAAQRNTQSGAEAARWLDVSYNTYKKYAKMYGLHEQHLNQGGKGTRRARPKVWHRIPLTEILEGKHPTYDKRQLKKRLVMSGTMDEQCSLCGFKERRVTDLKAPLMLVFKDGDSTNHLLDNMYLLCFNCAYLTAGELTRINPYRLKQRMDKVETAERAGEIEDLPLTEDEIAAIVAEAQGELENE